MVDHLIETLKKKFLCLLPRENIPKTPEITTELNYLIQTIKELEAENLENENDNNNNNNNEKVNNNEYNYDNTKENKKERRSEDNIRRT